MSSTSRRKVLCITLEPLSEKMAGPAIRAFELGKQLAEEFAVTVASPCSVDNPIQIAPDENLKVEAGVGKSRIVELASDAEVLFVQANVLKPFPQLASLEKYLVVDLYDPYLFSLLAQYSDDEATASSSYRLMHQVLERHMLAADFTVCASEKQRDYWLGRFCALGRLSPKICQLDPTLRKLIDVVPFGLQSDSPTHTRKVIKGVVPGINPQDKVLLWSGGIWDWFDPLTIIKAMQGLTAKRPDVKLFFMGVKSPNPQVPLMPMARAAQELAAELELLGKSVFFAEEWVKYEERGNYLLEADAAVSAHFDSIETRFSFRTRILDNFWAALPVLTTHGDPLAELIAKRNAGIALPYKDVESWADAIDKITSDESFNLACRKASGEIAREFAWPKTAAALREYCRDPHRLPPHEKVTMPSMLERAHAVYSRGGKDLFIKRSRELLKDMLK
ncbi:MAG TPA: glycosyltransferase family 4 protein [Oculatellaceae cyanobacterium]